MTEAKMNVCIKSRSSEVDASLASDTKPRPTRLMNLYTLSRLLAQA